MTTTKRPPGDEEWRRLVEDFEWLEDHCWVLPPEERRLLEREKPKAEKPPENLTASRLREAIDLGVKMAEADALLMLTRKARQVRRARPTAAAPDRRQYDAPLAR